MKIAIISDTHDNVANIEAFLTFAKKEGIEGLIHCGDVTTPETLKYLVEGFSGPLKLVCGNAEIRREEFFTLAKSFPNLEVFADVGYWEYQIPGVEQSLNLAFVHQPEKMKGLALSGKYDFIFYGHTHKPWIKLADEGESFVTTLVVNPGTLGGVFTSPTFAILETKTKKLELKRLWP